MTRLWLRRALRDVCVVDEDTTAADFDFEAVEACDEGPEVQWRPGRTSSRGTSRGTSRRPSALAPTPHHAGLRKPEAAGFHDLRHAVVVFEDGHEAGCNFACRIPVNRARRALEVNLLATPDRIEGGLDAIRIGEEHAAGGP